MIDMMHVPRRKNPESVAAEKSRQRRLDRIEDATSALRYVVEQGWMPLSLASEIAKRPPYEQKLMVLLHGHKNGYAGRSSEVYRRLRLNLNGGQRVMLYSEFFEETLGKNYFGGAE